MHVLFDLHPLSAALELAKPHLKALRPGRHHVKSQLKSKSSSFDARTLGFLPLLFAARARKAASQLRSNQRRVRVRRSRGLDNGFWRAEILNYTLCNWLLCIRGRVAMAVEALRALDLDRADCCLPLQVPFACCLLLAAGCWLLAAGCLLPAAAACRLLSAAGRLPLAACCGCLP